MWAREVDRAELVEEIMTYVRTARNVSLQFDASPPDGMATLDLSEAIG